MINLKNSRHFGTAISTTALAGALALAFVPAAYAQDGNGTTVSPESPNSAIVLMTGNISFSNRSPYQPGTDHSLDPIAPLAVSPENPHSIQLLVAGRFGHPTPASNQPYSASPVVNPENPNSAAITMGIPQT